MPANGRARLSSAQRSIGAFLRSTREAQRLTQEQVASLTRDSPWRLSRAAISAIERGQNFPGMEAMLALSSVLHVDPKELIERARLSTIVPIDLTGIGYEELDSQANQAFWAGDYRGALSIYDAMLERMALDEHDSDPKQVARLEVNRATSLRRAGALLAATATAERAIALSDGLPEVQADAYVVLSDLHCHRGNLPLARDSAERAVELAEHARPQARGWAWMAMGRVGYLRGDYENARLAYQKARELARELNDVHHQTHIEGNVGLCWLGLGQHGEARKWLRRAVDLSREHDQPALEATWLIELGKLSVVEQKLQEAESFGSAALRIAKPRELYLSVFRAEWLLHRVARLNDPDNPDRHRLHYLRKVFQYLDEHEGIEEVREFRRAAMRAAPSDGEGW